MSWKTFKEYSKWLSQFSAAVSLVTLVFIKSKFIFEYGNTAEKLVLITMVTAMLTLVFGIITLPRWQGIVALGIFSVVTYCLFFTHLYAIP